MAQTLALHSESEFDHRAPEGYPVSCPTLDLCATCDAVGKNIYIHRPPSQVVSKIHQLGPPGTKAPEALAVTWNAHGTFVLVRLIGPAMLRLCRSVPRRGLERWHCSPHGVGEQQGCAPHRRVLWERC